MSTAAWYWRRHLLLAIRGRAGQAPASVAAEPDQQSPWLYQDWTPTPGLIYSWQLRPEGDGSDDDGSDGFGWLADSLCVW